MAAFGSESGRVGIFGGSFNPPHVAHLIIAETICEQFGLDYILWIPSRQNPLKQPLELASADERLEMTRLAVAGNPRFELSEVEIGRSGVSYTVDTVRELQAENPRITYSLIVGTDSLQSFSRWHQPDEILRRVPLIAFRRIGSENARLSTHLEGHISFADAPIIQLSGTEIRERVRSGRSIRYMVPDAVRHYIRKRRLYLDSKEE